MEPDADLRELLAAWPYDPGQDTRVIEGVDGRPVLQVRTPLGIEQLEMDGRPDSATPHGAESALVFHEERLASAREAGEDATFELDADQCAELFSEGTLYYLRYLRLFQLKDWFRTLRDTSRNLRLFDFIRLHASREEDRNHLEKWRPYLLRMHGAAAALQALEQNEHDRALGVLQTTLDRIEALPEIEDTVFGFERARSLDALKDLRRRITKLRPVSELERLQRQLSRAIERQEFERAAVLRDRIRALRGEAPVAKPETD